MRLVRRHEPTNPLLGLGPHPPRSLLAKVADKMTIIESFRAEARRCHLVRLKECFDVG